MPQSIDQIIETGTPALASKLQPRPLSPPINPRTSSSKFQATSMASPLGSHPPERSPPSSPRARDSGIAPTGRRETGRMSGVMTNGNSGGSGAHERSNGDDSLRRERELQRERESRENRISEEKDNEVDDGDTITSARRNHYDRSASYESTSTMRRGGTLVTDFFSPEIFQIVLHNPTTAHRFLRYCQSRACGESMEFLQKVDAYERLLDQVTQSLSAIQSTYTSANANRQINVPSQLLRRTGSNVKQATMNVLPGLEVIFNEAQDFVKRQLAADIYPRFVKHQVTTAATIALAGQREMMAGLGDCFCLTDPMIADNPIVFASDGFVSVTGYTRPEIIPRNCRFLQGELTDRASTQRLRQCIDLGEETVELLLNYRKNGDPFWNLLYVSPLYNDRGEVSFFLGGQINCSTTIHSNTDVLKVLSTNDDELDLADEVRKKRPETRRSDSVMAVPKTRSSFFKSFRKYNPASPGAKASINVREAAGVEFELMDRLGKLNFRTQVEAFYTAYSKYLVLSYHPATSQLLIRHYSPGIIDMLGLNLPNGGVAPIFTKDIFSILSEHSSSSSVSRALKETVRSALARGKALSVEIGLLTKYEERKSGGGGGLGKLVMGRGVVRSEERYVAHWTPLKDQGGEVKWCVLTIAPK